LANDGSWGQRAYSCGGFAAWLVVSDAVFFLLLSLGSLSMVAPGRCRETGCVHGGARLTERFLSPVPARPDSNQRVRISGLKNVA
jgi:hypothetical protein